MIIELLVAWEAEATGQHGEVEKYRISGGAGLQETYNSIGRPHGPGREGLATFIENMLTAIAKNGGQGDPFGIMSGGKALPGYKPWVKVKILGNDEKDVAPHNACEAYQPRQLLYSLEEIVEAAPVDEEGQKWAYTSVICEFWATSLDDCDKCPNETCPAHCPHCGSPLVKVPLDHFVEGFSQPTNGRVLGVASYGPNSPDGCHVFPSHYVGEANRIGNKLKEEARLRALDHQEIGRYAHVIPGYEPLAARTCPRCAQAAIPVALLARDKSGEDTPAKWLLTWDCGQRHYDIGKPGAIAPWPFVEEYATPADLEAVGFRVVK